MMDNKPELTSEQHDRTSNGLEKVANFCLMLLVAHEHVDVVFKDYAASMVAASDTGSWGDEVYHCAMTDVAERYEKMVVSRGTKGWPGSELETLSGGHVHGAASYQSPFSKEMMLAEVCGLLYRAGSILIAVRNDLWYGDKDVTAEQAIVVAEEKIQSADEKMRSLGYMKV